MDAWTNPTVGSWLTTMPSRQRNLLCEYHFHICITFASPFDYAIKETEHGRNGRPDMSDAYFLFIDPVTARRPLRVGERRRRKRVSVRRGEAGGNESHRICRHRQSDLLIGERGWKRGSCQFRRFSAGESGTCHRPIVRTKRPAPLPISTCSQRAAASPPIMSSRATARS